MERKRNFSTMSNTELTAGMSNNDSNAGMSSNDSNAGISNNDSNAGMSFLAKRRKVKVLLKWIVRPAIARNRAENAAAESEDSETEEIITYDVPVQGEVWVVPVEIRDALLRGSLITCIPNTNGMKARNLFLAKKPLLKWIVGPAVARNRARITCPSSKF